VFRFRFVRYDASAMATLLVHAYAFASTFAPKDVAPLLEKAGRRVRTMKTQTVAECAVDGGAGWIIAYDFGAVVFAGIDEATRDAVLDALLKRFGPEPHPPIEDEMLVETADDERPAVRFDRVVAPAIDRRLVELVSLVVAQSVAMEYYEEDVDLVLARLNKMSSTLAESGNLPSRPRELLRFIGSGMSTHNQVVFTLALLDTPELAWEDETLDRIYSGLRTQLEIGDRFRALDLKLRMIHDSFSLFVELTQERRAYRLDWMIAVLVALEVVLFVYEIFYRTR
jgi:uncharacterized Rmd1/YagE family protein